MVPAFRSPDSSDSAPVSVASSLASEAQLGFRLQRSVLGGPPSIPQSALRNPHLAMSAFLFYLFATLTLGSALLVVLNRNAVSAAMSLFLAFIGMAGLFVLLEAYFLALLQVMVYAGAVVVIFVFIVMLLDVDKLPRQRLDKLSKVAATLAFGLMVTGVFWLFNKEQFTAPALPAEATGAVLKTYGRQLFTTYLLPMQVTGFLLLSARIGVIVISKKSALAATEETQ